MLDITEADAGDFRKGAFEQMLSFLNENDAIENKPRPAGQLPLQFYDSFIVCGRTCSGKSTIGKFLVDEYGYYHIEASEFMTHKRHETHGANSKVDKHLFAAEVLKVEPVFVVDSLINYMHENRIDDRFVITGFRTKDEIECFLNRFYADRIHLIFINTDFEERFRRWKFRQRDIDCYTEKRFKEIDAVQEGMGIGEIAEMPNIIEMSNNGDGLSSIYKAFRKNLISDIKRNPITINRKMLKSMKISLERAILITMALEYRKDVTKWYTTTEISYLMNDYFKLIKRSKNNVSRYFNQAFYVYYEIQRVGRKNNYRISPFLREF